MLLLLLCSAADQLRGLWVCGHTSTNSCYCCCCSCALLQTRYMASGCAATQAFNHAAAALLLLHLCIAADPLHGLWPCSHTSTVFMLLLLLLLLLCIAADPLHGLNQQPGAHTAGWQCCEQQLQPGPSKQ
jgi:hypothetical protein